LFVCLFVGWLAGWLAGWMDGWLDGWLVGQSIHQSMCEVVWPSQDCSLQTTLPAVSGLGDLYLVAMDAIHHAAPAVPFFLEGTGQSVVGANWGDGFATDAQLIRHYGLSDPNSFFQVPPVNRLQSRLGRRASCEHGLLCSRAVRLIAQKDSNYSDTEI